MKAGKYEEAADTAYRARENLEGLDSRLSQLEPKTLAAMARAKEHIYFYLERSGKGETRSIVEVRKSDGQVQRRVQLPSGLEREITYEVDYTNDRVFIQHKSGMFAQQFPPRPDAEPGAPSEVDGGGTAEPK